MAVDLPEFDRIFVDWTGRARELQEMGPLCVEPHELLERTEQMLEELRAMRDDLAAQKCALVETEAKLEAERLQLRDYWDGTPVGHVVTDGQGIVQRANAAAAELLGMPSQHLPKKPLTLFLPEEARAEFRRRLAELARNRVGWESPLLSARNERRVVQIAAFCNEASRPREVLFTLVDVTAQAARECALKTRCEELERRLLGATSSSSPKAQRPSTSAKTETRVGSRGH